MPHKHLTCEKKEVEGGASASFVGRVGRWSFDRFQGVAECVNVSVSLKGCDGYSNALVAGHGPVLHDGAGQVDGFRHQRAPLRCLARRAVLP